MVDEYGLPFRIDEASKGLHPFSAVIGGATRVVQN